MHCLGGEFTLDLDKSRMDIVNSRETSKVVVKGWITMKLYIGKVK